MVEASLAGERDACTPGPGSVEERIASATSWFNARRITPVPRTVNVPEHVAQFVGGPTGARLVYFVTEDDPQSVFYDEVTGSFGAAWGPDVESGEYIDIGQRSPDPLALAFA